MPQSTPAPSEPYSATFRSRAHQSFGTELRRRRTAAGLSLADFAKRVHYSKSHLSKVETREKPPSIDLARRCDAALSCGGELARLVEAPAREEPTGGQGEQGEIWLVGLGANGASHISTARPEQVRTAGLAGLSSWAGRPDRGRRGGADDATVASMRIVFDEMRRLGQTISAVTLLPALVTNTHLLQSLAADAAPRTRDAALVLAARFAEFAGWMAQENGDNAAAEWWTNRAVELAAAGSNSEMAAYALVRRALITLYRHDAIGTIELARQAQQAGCGTRVRGLAAQREAQGHAMAGDDRACFDALHLAKDLLAEPAEPDPGPVIGTIHADPVGFATGWCLFDLGRPEPAAELLARELDLIPEYAIRARARYGARLALAYAGSREVEQACTVIEPVLGTHDQVDSATVRADLSSLARELNRWHSHPRVRETMPHLNAALHNPRSDR